MKTNIFFIAAMTALLLTCQSMQAQIKFGVHAAGNLETQAELGQLWTNSDMYQGFLMGGYLDYRIGNTFSVQTELNYQKKGGKFSSTYEGVESTLRREFNYITVPLLLKGNFFDKGLGDSWEFSLFTGPYVGFLTSAHSSINTAGNKSPIDIHNQADKKDFGTIFGVGVSYKLNNSGAIIAELRYQMGLSEVDKLDTGLRNKGMGITLGYRF
jgi:hypothetical protein